MQHRDQRLDVRHDHVDVDADRGALAEVGVGHQCDVREDERQVSELSRLGKDVVVDLGGKAQELVLLERDAGDAGGCSGHDFLVFLVKGR